MRLFLSIYDTCRILKGSCCISTRFIHKYKASTHSKKQIVLANLLQMEIGGGKCTIIKNKAIIVIRIIKKITMYLY